MTKYEAVRAKIAEVCPELMELSFGCKVKVNLTNGGGEMATFLGYSKDGLACTTWAEFHENKESVQYEIPTRVLVIGHTPRLSHVLRAINKRLSPGIPSCLITSFGRLTVEMRTEGTSSKYIFEQWDLEKDDLSLQSPETIDFLFNILCE